MGKFPLPDKIKLKFANKSESHRTRRIIFVHLLEDKKGQSNGNDSFGKQESFFISRKHNTLSVFQSIAIHTDVCSTGSIKPSKSSFRQAKESVLPFHHIKYDRSGKTA